MAQRVRTRGAPVTVSTVFQPIVDLSTGAVVGAEALSRDVSGRRSIAEIFETARRTGGIAALDWQCRMSALESWLRSGAVGSQSLFVNVEPDALGSTPPPEFPDLLARIMAAGVRIVVEVTERQLTRNPRDLFRFRDQLHERGWALAVDDIGVDPASLAILPLLEPDIIKLDMQLMRRAPDLDTARVVNAVNAHASRTGALVLAEGIETEDQAAFAVSAGARLGQGWLFGRPEPLVPSGSKVAVDPIVVPSLLRHDMVRPQAVTPWDLVAQRSDLLRARKPLLRAISRHLELQSVTGDPSTIVLAAFQERRHLTSPILEHYRGLAEMATFVGAMGVGMESSPAPGVRGCAIVGDNAMRDQWVVVVISPYFAAALIAQDTYEPAATDADRQFDYLVTYDRALVLDAGRLMMQQFGAAGIDLTEGDPAPEPQLS